MSGLASKRVLFPFVGDSVGGAHISAALLIEGLGLTDYTPVVVIHEDGPLGPFLEARGITYQRLALPNYVGTRAGPVQTTWDIAHITPRLVRFMRDEDISIVHCNDTRMNLSWVLPARLSRTRFVWHQRAVVSQQRSLRPLIRSANAVMCISEYVRKGLPPGVDSVVIDNPFVRAAVDRRTAREELARNVGHVDDETLVIGFFGRLVGWKHPETVIDTVATIRNRSSRSVIACLFGADPDDLASQLTDHAKRLGVAHRIDLMGFKDPVAPWIAASDVVLAPSEDEPFGRSLVEAMLLGTPVVASRSGAHPEVIEDGRTGLLVDLGNVEQMAAAVEALADDAGLRDRIIAAALEKARAHYSVDSHVAKVLELYESILTR